MIIADLATGTAGLHSDRIRPLGVTSKTRSKKYPNIPTLDESGVPGYEVNTWMGFFAPAGTPKKIIARLESGIEEALKMPDVRERLEGLGMDVRSGSSDEMRQVLASDIAKWSKLVHENHINVTP
jgi:tripartite-type tricarboxylate transporter receptor subunit TctC